ncbi:MAG: exodeoxyribonuclease VII large subunit [Chitinophagales bacterium]|nr:exodeoxyribonuclease VII large subunit [Chitinophagales bacterium]MDW8419894.1 exodeoxyribonuclease VII large subunit [Chitinophagales bacterium]
MTKTLRLSELISEIDDVIQSSFAGETYWITAEIADVKKVTEKRWCFLKFIEKDKDSITAEIKGVFWANTFYNIEKFETLTGQQFASGLEITCNVRVRFHKRFGISLEVLDIDYTYSIGKLELEKQQTLDRLVKENPKLIRFVDGEYITINKSIKLPQVLQRIALVTAPNSDGQRDFKQEIEKNKYGYAFLITEYLTQIQGDNASKSIIQKLNSIEAEKENYDVVVIVRGGGSQTDLKPFDDYELSKYVASFPLPILTGIGHDRNTSIVDLMARQHKTPTKVATSIVEHNYNFECEIMDFKMRIFGKAEMKIKEAKDNLLQIKRTVKAYSPKTVLNKGYAIIISNDKIIVNPKELKPNINIKTILKNEIIHSIITKKLKNEFDI